MPSTSPALNSTLSPDMPHAASMHVGTTRQGHADAAFGPWRAAFVAATLIDTNLGPRRVERLSRGDRVWTAENGYQPIRWIAARKVTVAQLQADPASRPLCIAAGAFGPGCPTQDLCLSQQHSLWPMGRPASAALQGIPAPDNVLAQDLTNGQSVRIISPAEDVTYVSFLLDGPQRVCAHGVQTEIGTAPVEWAARPHRYSLPGAALCVQGPAPDSPPFGMAVAGTPAASPAL
ncbi:MAG: hypothetical protein RLZZ437_1624 [Pseudomonadota bacterium]